MPASTAATALFPFDNRYARLPGRTHVKMAPTPVKAPELLLLNDELARLLGADPAALRSPEGVAALAGNRVPEGAEPLAQAYAGHQFGGWVPQLGDGRAILLGEVVGTDGIRRDVQLKGSGPTPFSRMGDGRAGIGPVLREYVVSEAMAALGVPTTRSLAAVATGEVVLRERPLPGAVLTRVARSHLRVGTFQFFAARDDAEALKALANFAIERHHPDAADAPNPTLALLDRVVAAQAALVARWQLIGFIHGVMNTDNCSIGGETIDYGPCAFMDSFDPAQVYSSIDQFGRYAYANQPGIAHWNLAQLAQALLPLIDEDEAKALEQAQNSIDAYPAAFTAAYAEGMRRKLGLFEQREGDLDLGRELLDAMAAGKADFTLTFRGLCDAVRGDDEPARGLFADPAAFDAWAAGWRERLAAEGGDPAERAAAMRAANPAVIPRNHLVEEALKAAADGRDLEPAKALIAVLANPYDDQPEGSRHALPPRPEEVVRATFCGT